MQRKKVVVFTTGGTIAMKYDPAVDGLVPAVSGEDLAAAVPGLAALCDVEVREFCNIASCDMKPHVMFELSGRVEAALAEPDVDGVVVTHGTDTVEETSYMCDLLHRSDKPVVFTAAMRGASDTSPDGPANIYCAVKTAASDAARGKGVLVVLNEVIHAAALVRKTHAANPATFESPWWGPLGYCDADRVIFRRTPADRLVFDCPALTARVDILPALSGQGPEYVDFAVSQGCRGIVIEGYGRGNTPPGLAPGIRRAAEAGVAVVITTRALAGRPYQAYAYPGSVLRSREMGAVKGGEHAACKLRILLMVALSADPGLADDPARLEALLDN
ncbi:MAG: asparaginase [Duodenibacillus sp.]|nr:asparaginase [Duodenibacillus sp.]